MRLNRFIIQEPLHEGPREITDRVVVRQLHGVLRLQVGDEIVLCDGAGSEAVAHIEEIGARSVRVFVRELTQPAREPKRHIVLYASVLKRENFELVVQKATEAGVAEIVPVVSARTVKLGVKRDRLELIIKEAAEQSGRTMLPVLHEPVKLGAALAHAKENDANAFFHVHIGPEKTAIPNGKRIGLFIGPEGGWEETEASEAAEAGCVFVRLGPLTLRGETAAIVATFLAGYQQEVF